MFKIVVEKYASEIGMIPRTHDMDHAQMIHQALERKKEVQTVFAGQNVPFSIIT